VVSGPGGDGVSAESPSEVCHGEDEVPGVPTPEVESASDKGPTELGAKWVRGFLHYHSNYSQGSI
jgi:hypothetical protein